MRSMKRKNNPEEAPQKTSALNEVFSSLAPVTFFAERERGDVGIFFSSCGSFNINFRIVNFSIDSHIV